MTMPTRLRFRSALHDERIAAWLGIALGVSFTVCFATGLCSHLLQNPPTWFDPPARPAGLYRVHPGPARRDGHRVDPAAARQALGRLPEALPRPPFTSVGVGVRAARACSRWSAAGSSCSVTGLREHQPLVPLAVQLPRRRTTGSRGSRSGRSSCTSAPSSPRPGRALRAAPTAPTTGRTPTGRTPDRRTFLGSSPAPPAALDAGDRRPDRLAAPQLALLAPADPTSGRRASRSTAPRVAAGVLERRTIRDYRLVVDGDVDRRVDLTLDDLRALPQQRRRCPSRASRAGAPRRRGPACASATSWTGRGPADARCACDSLQQRRAYRDVRPRTRPGPTTRHARSRSRSTASRSTSTTATRCA